MFLEFSSSLEACNSSWIVKLGAFYFKNKFSNGKVFIFRHLLLKKMFLLEKGHILFVGFINCYEKEALEWKTYSLCIVYSCHQQYNL